MYGRFLFYPAMDKQACCVYKCMICCCVTRICIYATYVKTVLELGKATVGGVFKVSVDPTYSKGKVRSVSR